MEHNPYAPPKAEVDVFAGSGGDALWREGKLAVTRKGVTWPERCVVCNAPADGVSLRRQMFWHHPAIYLLFLVSWLVYVIVALIVRKHGEVYVGLCPRHRKRRKRGFLIGWLGFPASFAVLAIGLNQGGSWLADVAIIAGLVGMLGTVIVGLVMARTVTPQRIDDHLMWIRVGRPFLESLPMSRYPRM